nr:FAR1 DNA binding domain-containing protein [Tanacetum cinerariifolium]
MLNAKPRRTKEVNTLEEGAKEDGENAETYKVFDFVKNHTHPLMNLNNMDLSRARRQSQFGNHLFIHRASLSNVGPTIAHRLKVALVGGYDKTVLADETMKCNYVAFGDVVSFDATFNTKYAGKSNSSVAASELAFCLSRVFHLSLCDLRPTSQVTSKFQAWGHPSQVYLNLYVEEQGGPMPENLENELDLKKTLDAAKFMYPGNTRFADLHKRYLESLQYQRKENQGTSRASMHTEDQTRTHERQKASSEAVDLTADEFDSRAYVMGPHGKSVDKVDEEIEGVKRIKDFEIHSFSLGLITDFEMGTGLDAPEFDMGPDTQQEVVRTAAKFC